MSEKAGNDEAWACASYLGAGVTIELDAGSVEVSCVLATGPNAWVNVFVCNVVN